MKLNRWPLAFIFTADALAAGAGGDAKFCRVRVLPKCQDDAGLLAHELTHVKQFWRLALLALPLATLLWWFDLPLVIALWPVLLHNGLYKFNARYRLYCEVAAYRVQATLYKDDRRPQFAKFISTAYRLDITPEQALQLLKD